jgi:hypothetical protein
MDSSHTGTPPKNEEEDDSDIDLTMFDSEDDGSSARMIVAITLKRWAQAFKYLVYLLLVS